MRRTHLKPQERHHFPDCHPTLFGFPRSRFANHCRAPSCSIKKPKQPTQQLLTNRPRWAPSPLRKTRTLRSCLDSGWHLRNLVAYLSFHLGLGGRIVSILCCRPGQVRRVLAQGHNDDDDDEITTSLVELDLGHDQSRFLHIKVPTRSDFGWIEENDDNSDAAAGVKTNTDNHDNMWVAGWELNPRGRPGPRSIHLRPLLDATHLAIQAADLNLQLMKWRMIPNLQVSMSPVSCWVGASGTLPLSIMSRCDIPILFDNPCSQWPILNRQVAAAALPMAMVDPKPWRLGKH